MIVIALGFYFFETRTNHGFHLRSLPKVGRTIMKPGVKFLDLFILWNMRETTLLTA